ncbi:MAG: sodium:alanine symporter family protein [Firmicutes bacterium]|nr:sodium:alanine symporter family protein [Bacillota bacterium]
MTKFLDWLNTIVWGAPALVLILGVGLFLSLRLRFVQLTLFPRAVREFFAKLRPGKKRGDGVSPFQALCTALAATVGTGNLVGVAGAICLGGPGAIFWMWVCGLLGMVTKYAEVTLALRYRVKTGDGYAGGPMYVITRGLGQRFTPLAKAYCLFGVVAAFGVGNAAQINAVISGVNGVLTRFGGVETRLGNFLMGLALAILIGATVLGGAKRIGAVAERLVPFVSAAYILLCAGVLIFRCRALPGAFAAILEGAFSPRAVTGGALGSAFQALRVGCSRGVFTNEAGMGTASIAHASAEVSHPSEQGLMGMIEVFLDTILICTLTALVILVSGVPIPYGVDVGGELTTRAFASVYGSFASLFLAAALACFAFATVLGWGLYGARCAQFLFGTRAWKPFAFAQTAAVVIGACMDTGAVWSAAETVNGLMVIPNLIALAMLTDEVVRLTKEYQKSGGTAAGGGSYANIHQRKSV